MSEKPSATIHDHFIFFTPKMVDIYFQFLQKKLGKFQNTIVLLVEGSDVPNLCSDAHVFDQKKDRVCPATTKKRPKENKDIEQDPAALNTASVQLHLKSFAKNQRKSSIKKSCIIDKKAS